MKSFSILVASAAVAVAQFGDLPSCGQVCMTNMNNIAVNEFNCTQGDVLCYCQKINYGYGVRDCANEACTSPTDAAAVIAYGTNYCAGAVSSAAPSTPSAPGYSVLSSAAGIGASGTGPSPTGTAGNETGTGGLATPISTVSGTATITSGSSVVTTTGAISTIFSTATGSIASSLSSVVSNVSSSLSSEMSGAASSASATGSAIESSLTGSASASGTSSSSEAAAPIATAAPLLGAGAMAILLAAL